MKSGDKNSKNKNEIRGPAEILKIITNGSLEELKRLQYPNELMKIFSTDNQNEQGEITPLVMIINQSSTNVQEKINALIFAGANPSLSFNYFGCTTTARELANKHRPQIIFS